MPLTQVSSRLIEDTLRYVLGASGTDHYTFTGKGLNGAVNDPTLTLSRGHTYIFENRSGGHPFYIKTSIANGGTNDAYNTGVTNNGGGNGTEIVFTVPHDAPDVLYYQCSSHSSMAGQLTIAGGIPDESITASKLASSSVTAVKIAAGNVDNTAIGNNQISLNKFQQGTPSNDGKFLRANNGADPSFESLPASGLSNVVEDTTPQLGGDLDSNGHNIKITDGEELRVGDGNDLTVFHDGSHSKISNSTGYLVQRSNQYKLSNVAEDHTYIKVPTHEGGVELYYDNAKKLETLGNGIRVQGGILFGSDTSEANKLDDYEEGQIDNQNVLNGWGYLGNGSDANQAPTMTYNGGKYVKIGSMVYVHMRIKIGNYNSIANDLVFGIMPFYADLGGTESLLNSHLGCWMNACSSGGENVMAHTYGGSKYYYGIFKRHGSGVSNFTGSNGGSGMDIAINGWYRIE